LPRAARRRRRERRREAMSATIDYEALFAAERRFVWRLCYRMTGSAADADDVLQETFVRAIAQPPPRTDLAWRPWLVRVAVNLARDCLRRRRRAPYRGPWLPAPIDCGGADAPEPPAYEVGAGAARSTEGRYELMESVSYAFLLALEALTPAQRAVLLLRDVIDYDVRETALALGMSEANVKTTHHRARRAMAAYNGARCPPTPARQAATGAALARFLDALQRDDVSALEALLAEDVRSVTDGGEYPAAHRSLDGRRRVLELFRGLVRKSAGRFVATARMLNGLPAVLIEFRDHGPRFAPRTVLRCEIDAAGRITALHVVSASRKLTALARGDG